ncbi:MAG: hypothetical protein ABJA10_02720 [Aestuariivirga sp.]
MIFTHKEYLPSFGIGRSDQSPVCLYTVLSVNEQVRDCAAYQGVSLPDADEAMLERLVRGGRKIREAEARDMFSQIETMQLRYRR